MNRRNFISLASIWPGTNLPKFELVSPHLGSMTETELSLRASAGASNTVAHVGFTSDHHGTVVCSSKTGDIQTEQVFERGATSKFNSITGAHPFYIIGTVRREVPGYHGKIFSFENGTIEQVVDLGDAHPVDPPLISQHSDLLFAAWNTHYPERKDGYIAGVDDDTGDIRWRDKIADGAIVSLVSTEEGVDVIIDADPAAARSDETEIREYSPDGSTQMIGRLPFAVNTAARGHDRLVVTGVSQSSESKVRPTITGLTAKAKRDWQTTIEQDFDSFTIEDITYTVHSRRFVMCGFGERADEIIPLVMRITEDGRRHDVRQLEIEDVVYKPRAVESLSDGSVMLSGDAKQTGTEGRHGWVFHLPWNFWDPASPTQTATTVESPWPKMTPTRSTSSPSPLHPGGTPSKSNSQAPAGGHLGFSVKSVFLAIITTGYLIKRRFNRE